MGSKLHQKAPQSPGGPSRVPGTVDRMSDTTQPGPDIPPEKPGEDPTLPLPPPPEGFPELGERMATDRPDRILTDDEVEQIRTSGLLLKPWDDQ